jgi:hypothetical protein
MKRDDLLLMLLGLFACGCESGADGSTDGGGASTSTSTPGAGGRLTLEERTAAAKATAESNPICTEISPFYWEIGDAASTLASGALGVKWSETTSMQIASASKWMYAAYVAEIRNGVLTTEDIAGLNFTSGYTSFDKCGRDDTVHSCAISGTNGVVTQANVGKFYYGGGHMQHHADVVMNLGAQNNATLALTIGSEIGVPSAGIFEFVQPQPAGGIETTPEIYAGFLRKMLNDEFQLSSQLSSHLVCTNELTCAEAEWSPFPADESPQYGLGHWVEDTDGAFSSPGAFGFYPWIDAEKSTYGMVARYSLIGFGSPDPKEHPYARSVFCGRLLRKAWESGSPQI